MIKKFLIILLISYLPISNAAETNNWKITQTSKNKNYQLNLQCEHPPTFSGFQKCNFRLIDKSKNIIQTKVIIDGGMPEHHHGLPTAPVSVWNSENNNYNINGLKFSMPGAWQLKFLIEKTQNLPRDIVTIKFEID